MATNHAYKRKLQFLVPSHKCITQGVIYGSMHNEFSNTLYYTCLIPLIIHAISKLLIIDEATESVKCE